MALIAKLLFVEVREATDSSISLQLELPGLSNEGPTTRSFIFGSDDGTFMATAHTITSASVAAADGRLSAVGAIKLTYCITTLLVVVLHSTQYPLCPESPTGA